MGQVSNGVIGLLNCLTLLYSFLIIGTAVILQFSGLSECDNSLQLRILALGIFVLVVSILGLIGSCCRVTFLIWLYMWVLLLLIVVLFCFTTFVFIVMPHKGVGEEIMGRAYKEYRLGEFSDWLQNNVVDNEDWIVIKSCMVSAQACASLQYVGAQEAASEFYQKNLSPIESGCCKPPTHCGFEYKNDTFWTVPKSGLAATDQDCITWSNQQNTLCYDCNSCKAGLLANSKNGWRNLVIFNIAFLVFLSIVFTISCCAFSNNRATDNYMKYRGYV